MHSHAGTIHVRSWSQAEVRRVCHGVTSDANDPDQTWRPPADGYNILASIDKLSILPTHDRSAGSRRCNRLRNG